MTHEYMKTIDHNHPMGAARIVRREHYTWPGGYGIALITTDGGMLCPDCVTDNFASISWSHRKKCSDGFQPAGMMSADSAEESMVCDHCGATIHEVTA